MDEVTKAAHETGLTANYVRSILDYDPATGVFRWRHRPDRPKKWNTRCAGKIAGWIIKPRSNDRRAVVLAYAYLQIDGSNPIPAHRVAWLIVYGEWPPGELDHKNRMRTDNRIDNLRPASDVENACNKAMQRNNTSGVIGVTWAAIPRKWEARISKDGRVRWRRFFATIEEAAQARAKALIDIHGDFAAI